MPYVAVVTVLALTQFFWFGLQVARARGRFGVPAPAVTGNETFERYFRVQMNTLEQLLAFLPALWMFASFVSPVWGAGLGGVYIIGRSLYARAYVREPRTREIGFWLTLVPTLVMLLGVVIWALRALLIGAAT